MTITQARLESLHARGFDRSSHAECRVLTVSIERH